MRTDLDGAWWIRRATQLGGKSTPQRELVGTPRAPRAEQFKEPVQWIEDPYEGYCLRRDEEECEDEPRSLYEKYPNDSSYYQDARGM